MTNKSLLGLLVLGALGLSQGANAYPLLTDLGGERGYGSLALTPNDDGSSSQLNLPFSLNFFGTSYSKFYINNNGNITFGGALGTFTPTAFPASSRPMIAPWWADVDTRGTHLNPSPSGSNNVWVAAPNPDTVVVTWDQVGYYSAATNKLNDFQLVLRNRVDTGAGNFDVDFRYNQLQWTTGSASGGSGGLGGTPAQAGYDAGNGANYFMLPGSRTAAVLDLDNTSNVSLTTPGLWTFAIRNGALPGSTPSNPLMPVYTEDGYDFNFNIQANTMTFIDPVVSVGYDYLVNSGPNIASVMLPAIGDNSFELWLWNGTGWFFDQLVSANIEHFFGGAGVNRFRVLGIETSANLDPTNTAAFITGLTFVSGGIVNMNMIPITQVVPEPTSLALFAMAVPLFGFRKRKA